MEEELEEMQTTTRFDFSVLKNPKFLLYLAYVILHAGGMLTIIILQPRYIEETKNMTGEEMTCLFVCLFVCLPSSSYSPDTSKKPKI